MDKLPLSVTTYKNRSTGNTSYRVEGRIDGVRIRKNFRDRAKADRFCNEKNAAFLGAKSKLKPLEIIQTHAPEAEVRKLEGWLTRIAGRWPTEKVFDAGIKSLEASRPIRASVPKLAEKWLTLMDGAVSSRWHADLRHRVTAFTSAHPRLTTDTLTRAKVRRWIDGLPHAQQTKANMRNAIHRFCGWLVERGYCKENPASGIRITRRRSGAMFGDRGLPPIFTPRQAEALLRACELGTCRRLLGWMATCLFTGMRPDSEATRAVWAEINFATGEWSVMGRKRGAKPRIIPMTETALAWLRVVKADQMERPAVYSRNTKVRAIALANEWLAQNHPGEKSIAWSGDVTRHSFASYRSAQISVTDLAAEMGTSTSTIYAHYRHPQTAAAVAGFWAIRPRLIV